MASAPGGGAAGAAGACRPDERDSAHGSVAAHGRSASHPRSGGVALSGRVVNLQFML